MCNTRNKKERPSFIFLFILALLLFNNQENICLLRRFSETSKEYRMSVVFIGDSYTLTMYLMEMNVGIEYLRGLFKCTELNKISNVNIVDPYNILVKAIALSSRKRIEVEDQTQLNKKVVTLNFSALQLQETFRAEGHYSYSLHTFPHLAHL